ncbi:MAG TPA: ABC transporter ATP-binding protein [Acidimicrobiales bacterium]|nr:ABC transporter ATP-binding protein [Acidimicrobiales bacterium]
MSELMVRVEGLTKRYGEVEALSGLSLAVKKGEIFGFIGPNGAGKTTALRVLAGLCWPTDGLVEVNGVDVLQQPALLRSLTGYMPDFFGVYGSMTAEEYLTFYASCYKVPRRVTGRVVDDLLALVELGAKREAQVESLSRGMKQRLCLARALVHDPELLLLDEPASGLDPKARADMRDLVRALGEMGKTVVLSSHILPELAEMCTSFGIIHKGKMVTVGPAQSLFASAGERRARARVQGDFEGAAGRARAVAGVTAVNVVGPGVLELVYSAAAPGPDEEGPAGLLRALVLAGVPVADFRPEEDDLERVFLELTSAQLSVREDQQEQPAVPAGAAAEALR